MSAKITPSRQPSLSGERFAVTYRIAGDESLARARAQEITLEQTVEFPGELVPEGAIRDGIVGRIESLDASGEGHFEARISYAVESAGGELPQLLNTVFGNTSIKPGIRVERLELPPSILNNYPGPRFGIPGIRKLLGMEGRPVLCTALKPQGLPPEDLAELAYRFALGGIDIIKDDHGIANQGFSAFRARAGAIARAVTRANYRTGSRAVYAPNVTAACGEVRDRAIFARECGAGALLVSPGLTGFDAMRALAADDAVALPVIAHPALLGSFTAHPDSGISHYALYGQLMRLAGADASIFPNFGGRFSFSREECRGIADGCAAPMGALEKIFPAPGGGMGLDKVAVMREFYGPDVMFLIGGGLFQAGDDLVENCRRFRELVDVA